MYIPITRGDSYVATFALLEADGSIHTMLDGEQLTFTAKTSKNMSSAKLSRYWQNGIEFNSITNKYEIDFPADTTSGLSDIDYPFDIEYVSQTGKVKTLLQGVFRVCLDVTEPQNRYFFNDVGQTQYQVRNVNDVWGELDTAVAGNEIILGDFKFSNAYRDKMSEKVDVIPSRDEQTIRARSDVYELTEVVVKPIPSEYTDVSQTTAESSDVVVGKRFYDKDGLLVEGTIETISINVKSSTEAQEIRAQNSQLFNEIIVEPIVGTKELRTNGIHDVSNVAEAVVNVEPRLQAKTVEPTTEQQIVEADDNFDGLGEVLVNAVNPSDYYKPENPVTVTPALSQQTIVPTEGEVFNEVVVNEISSSVIPNLIPSNIRKGVTIIDVEGNLDSDKPDQSKTITPSEEEQHIFADTGYELTDVIVEAIPSDYVGSQVVKKGEATYYPSDEDQTIESGVFLSGVQTIKKITLEDKVVNPTENIQVVSPSEGVTAIKQVTINPISSGYVGSSVERKGEEVYFVSEEDRVIATNTYLTGNQTIKGIKLDEKTATPSEVEQIIESDVDGLKRVVLEAIPSNWLDTTNEANIYKGEVE